MGRAGCYEVGIGLETTETSVLENMGKNTSVSDCEKTISFLQKAQVPVKFFLIEGYKGASSQSVKDTFDFLKKVESSERAYLIQPAFSRDIMPHQDGFKTRMESGILGRGNINQLDFNVDGRNFGWDNDRDIRAMGYYMLAFPSTEMRHDSNTPLQDRLSLDLPFLTNQYDFRNAIKMVRMIESDDEFGKIVLHYLTGNYTPHEISHKASRILRANEEVMSERTSELIDSLRDRGMVDSFGNPNSGTIYLSRREVLQNSGSSLPEVDKDFMAFSDGVEQRWFYLPNGKDKTMRFGFYQDIPESVFEFSVFARGVYDIRNISEKMYRLYGDSSGDFSSESKSLDSTKKIERILRKERILK